MVGHVSGVKTFQINFLSVEKKTNITTEVVDAVDKMPSATAVLTLNREGAIDQ